MLIKTNITSVKAELDVFNFSQDDCYIKYINNSSTAKTVTDEFEINGVTYQESRYLPAHKTSSFCISEYVKQDRQDWKTRMCLNGVTEGFASYNAKKVKLKEGETNVGVLPMYFIDGSNVRDEKMCATRYHLYNPNYPHLMEWYANSDKTFQLRFNDEDEAIYTLGEELPYNIAIGQVLLNKYTDDMYNEEGMRLSAVFPHHLESSSRIENEYDSWGLAQLNVGVTIQRASNVRSDIYLYDTRTKGVFLRFIDRFGLVQQLLLNVASTENTISVADGISSYQGKQMKYDGNVLDGDGIENNKWLSEVIHCNLEHVSKELKGDVVDLLLSPIVYMYRGGFDAEEDNDTECKWERVRVTSSGVITNEKKALMTVSLDVLTTTRNGYEI